ncbi:MAG: hypothetical protein JWO60_264, partial [Frankiales bacterium]|nr:hypothetical protein [Frankiales bacterium]
LARLADVVGAPVGLENLATALGPSDVRDQGGLLEDLLAPTDGWLVLDLHNLWCQAVNAGLDAGELLGTYPLTRVREVHVSGGSWWSPAGSDRRVRRDTHDGPVPDEVLALLPRVLRDCPGLETVVVEQVGRSLGEPAQDAAFRDGFRTVRALCGRPA